MRSRGRRILIVDDEPAITKLLDAAFTRAGYEVRVAATGPEAVALFDSEPFDVLLSDVKMPGGMNGHDVSQHVARRYPAARRVLMSGFDDTQCWNCGVGSAPCAFVHKPFDPRTLVAMVDGFFDGTPTPLTQIS